MIPNNDTLGIEMTVTISDNIGPARQCGGCTACCKILPVPETEKLALTRCQHQRHGKGCAIYSRRPLSCRFWSCGWLRNDDTFELSRPDRSGIVIDMMPDFVTLKYGDRPDQKIPVVQVWIDPARPLAHRDPAFRRYVERRGEQGMMALIRIGSAEAWVLCPPNLAHDHQWHEHTSNLAADKQHSVQEVMAALAEAAR